MDLTEYMDIAPFNDEEASAALTRLSNHPNTKWISKRIFPDQPDTLLGEILRNIHTVDEFQSIVMTKAIQWVIDHSVTQFTYDGLENLTSIEGKYLAMSNHRDIILDPAFLQLILLKNGLPDTQICVGDNLLKQKSVELLIRSNRMIKVIRGISARELYLSSQLLSKYIREVITSGTSSVWIAQRQGRTKDGVDTTEQGLLKMFDMSGTKDFTQNFKELNIIIKADVQGSAEAVKQSLIKLSNDEVRVKVIHSGVGAINESDVMLASTSGALIVGFNVRPDAAARDNAQRSGVEMRMYRVIYDCINEVEAAMKGMLAPKFEEKVIGHVEIRQTFKVSKVGTVCGGYVQDGKIVRNSKVRVLRDNVVVYEGDLASLRRFKDDVKEVASGYECGLQVEKFNDIKEGDVIEVFVMEQIQQ